MVCAYMSAKPSVSRSYRNESRGYPNEIQRQSIRNANKRETEYQTRANERQREYDEDHNARIQLTIDELEIEKKRLKEKLRQPLELSDIDRYKDRIEKIDLRIKYHKSRMK